MKVFIIGGGRSVYFLTKAFFSKGHTVTLVNKNHAECVDLARRLKATVVHGDGTDPGVLDEAGVRSADALIALTPFDHDNLVACQVAQLEFGVPRVLALIGDPNNRELFAALDVKVFSATPMVVSMIEQNTALDEITSLMSLGEGEVNVTQIQITSNAPAAGVMVRDLNLPHDALIVAILREQQPPLVPHGATEIQAEDQVIVVTTPDNYARVVRMLTGETI